MTPLPHHSTSSLRPLNPTTSHNNNNNGSGQHASASTAADIEPIRVTGAKYYAPLPRSPCTRHCCLLLVMFGFSSTVCLYRAKAFCASSVSSSPFSSRMVIELAHNSSENPVAQTADRLCKLNWSRCCPHGSKSFQRNRTHGTDLFLNVSPQTLQMANSWPGVFQALSCSANLFSLNCLRRYFLFQCCFLLGCVLIYTI